ncbi:hypothetical protein EW146_g10186 [Bondarzewia mesenterica]|uniref:DUF6589 domain-containing protein n=1 Tax=Bondarzewia mesenterica TaxID=1095465 RepID=A0A4S4KZN2_9AGAM|nr:hypothetical protein EW146_g10186 [Bondarzewia mesenterica]
MGDIDTEKSLQAALGDINDPRLSASSSNAKAIDEVLKCIQKNDWTLGHFLLHLFAYPAQNDPRNTATRSTMVSHFLGGRLNVKPEEIVELMYSSKYSAPLIPRNSKNRSASEVEHRDETIMARWRLRQWAIEKVEKVIEKEAEAVSSKEGGLHLSNKDASWTSMHNFSLANILAVIEQKGPTFLRLLIAAAKPASERPKPCEIGDNGAGPSYAIHFSKPAPSGKGKNRRDPLMIFAIWLFAHTAPHGVYAVLNRLGLSVSYTTVLKLLRSLSHSAKGVIRTKARTRAFLVIYDNINRMARAWDPDLGQKDHIYNGTAATFIELEDCNPERAFDTEPLRNAREQEQRKGLDWKLLYQRVKWDQVNEIFALHSLAMLVEATPSLVDHQAFIQLQFRTRTAVRQMRNGRKTTLHPLETTNFNEGNTAENAKVLDDLLLNQLGMPKEEVDRLLVIVGGDQSTVEKLRTLKKFLASCPHGYARYGWVLPLIQLWHMGWADLERVLNTHWGNAQVDDPSSFGSANILLGRKVKDVKRPDYYPAQHLVFDTLKADILDCWRIHLRVDDLDDHFHKNPVEIEELLGLARDLCARYLSAAAYDQFCKRRAIPGDQVLADAILRMRDSMLHYEFQCAVAEGDIGRVMNIMSVWTYTFTGSGKNKYSNELLELTCNFEFEYSEDLKNAILDNWLCNLSGIEGCWFPMDLLQEKNIKQLKKMSQKRNTPFGGAFFKAIIAVNIRAFLEAITTMKTSVRLVRTGASHRRTAKTAAAKELTRNMAEQGLHKFRAGRQLGRVAQDDFEMGYLRFQKTSRILDFIERTIRDAGAIHADGDEAVVNAGDIALNPAIPTVVPNMVINGSLIVPDEEDLAEEDEEDESEIREDEERFAQEYLSSACSAGARSESSDSE